MQRLKGKALESLYLGETEPYDRVIRPTLDQLSPKENPFNPAYKDKTLSNTFNAFLIECIEKHYYNIYIPFLEDLFELGRISVSEEVVKTIAVKNPNFTFFTPRLIELILQRHTSKPSSDDFGTFYFRIREKTTYPMYQCTLYKNGLHWNDFVEETFRFKELFNAYFDCWMEYLKTHSVKLVDDGKHSNYFDRILNTTALRGMNYRKIIGSILFHLELNPKFRLFEEVKNVKNAKQLYLDENNRDILKYMLDICEFIYDRMFRASFYLKVSLKDESQREKELLDIFKQCFPFKPKSRFVCILQDLIVKDFNVKAILVDDEYNQYEFRKLFSKYIIEIDRYFKESYGISLETEDIDDTNRFEIAKKEFQIKESFDEFIQRLPKMHQKMITLRTQFKLRCYTKDLPMDELNKVDAFGLTPLAYAILFRNREAVKFLTTTSASSELQDTIDNKKIDYTVPLSYQTRTFNLLELAQFVGDSVILRLLETKDKLQKRWKSNTIVGYHQTDDAIADVIQNSHENEYWFLAGSKGMYGAGIYFAETEEETTFKARQHGVILKANLFMGNPMHLTSFEDRDDFQDKYIPLDVDMIHKKLQSVGYDSVIAHRGEEDGFMQSGTEFIVYNTEQVELRKNSVVKRSSSSSSSGGSLSKGKVSVTLNTDWVLPIQQKKLAVLETLPPASFKQRWLLQTTPLMIAAGCGHYRIVAYLLEKVRVPLEAKDALNRNALFYAMRGGNKKIIQLLIRRGISLLEPDANGRYVVEYFNENQRSKDTSYRTVLLDALYKIGSAARPCIARFYEKTGRLANEKEQLRYKALLALPKDERIAKPVLVDIKIPKKTIVPQAAGSQSS